MSQSERLGKLAYHVFDNKRECVKEINVVLPHTGGYAIEIICKNGKKHEVKIDVGLNDHAILVIINDIVKDLCDC